MGNQFIGEFNQTDACELFLDDLGGISYESTLVNGRLLKSEKCWSDDGYFVVVKVYLKQFTHTQDRRSSGEEGKLSEVRIKLIDMNKRLLLENQPNILPYFRVLETDKAGYLVRQFCYINLTDRISTRPFLTKFAKYWLTFQILNGLSQLHDEKVGLYHGDLKSENIVLTGWDWLFLTDLAPFKPKTLSTHNTQSIFSYFFDTSERGSTTLAPERFGDKIVGVEKEFTQKMDIFSAGCVIAQLYLDGRELFNFSELLAYKDNKMDRVNKMLEEIKDKKISMLVSRMLCVDPSKRPTANKCLELLQEFIPGFFKYLHTVFGKLLVRSCDDRLDAVCELYDDLVEVIKNNGKKLGSKLSHFISTGEVLTSENDEDEENDEDDDEVGTNKKNNPKKDEIYKKGTELEENEKTLQKLISETELLNKIIKDQDVEEFEKKIREQITQYTVNDLYVRGVENQKMIEDDSDDEEELNVTKYVKLDSIDAREGMDIIASLICSSVRTARRTQTIVKGLVVMKKLAFHTTDYTRLQRIVPYTCSLLSKLNDKPPLVKVSALKVLSFVLSQVEKFPSSETNLFSDYILSTLKPLVNDESDLVKICLAEYLPFFAEQSKRFLEIEQTLKKQENGLLKGDYDSKLETLRNSFNSILQDLAKDSCDFVKISLLKNMDKFCEFAGKKSSTHDIVPILITFLNSSSWRLRAEFLKRISSIGEHLGISAVKQYVLPCIDQSLHDSEEFVVDSAIHSIVTLTNLHLFSRHVLLDHVAPKIRPLLFHPNTWIRYDSIGFFVALSKELGNVDTYCFILPELEDYMTCKVSKLTVYSLLESLKEPLERDVFDCAVRKIESAPNEKVGIDEWIQILNMDISHEQAEKIEKLKGFCAMVGMTLRRKMKPKGVESEKDYIKPPKLRTLTDDNVNLKNFEFLRKTAKVTSVNVPLVGGNIKNNDDDPFRPVGNLFAHTNEHKESITALHFYEKGDLLITGSEDSTVKIWDLKNFGSSGKNQTLISKMNFQVYSGAGYVTSCTSYIDHPYIIFSTSKGWIQIFDALGKTITDNIVICDNKAEFVKQIDSRNSQQEYGASINVIKPFELFNSTVILAGTQNGRLHAIDRSSKHEVFQLHTKNSLQQGPISCVCGADVWMVSGTKRGFLTLWDLRFHMPIIEWRISETSVTDMILSTLQLPKNSPSIYISCSNNEITEWNLENSKKKSVFKCSQPGKFSEGYKAETKKNIINREDGKSPSKAFEAGFKIASKAHDMLLKGEKKEELAKNAYSSLISEKRFQKDPFAIKEIQDIDWNSTKISNEIKTLSLNDNESFFCGGTDRKIRLWNVNEIESSYVVTGQSPNENIYYSSQVREDKLKMAEERIHEKRGEREKHGIFSLPVNTFHIDSITKIRKITTKQGLSKLVSCDKEGKMKFWD